MATSCLCGFFPDLSQHSKHVGLARVGLFYAKYAKSVFALVRIDVNAVRRQLFSTAAGSSAVKNMHDSPFSRSFAKYLKKFVPWFEKNGVRIEYYQLVDSKEMEGVEGIAKTLSVGEDEEVWMELQYFGSGKHGEEAYAKMMKDKSIEPLAKVLWTDHAGQEPDYGRL